MIDDELTVDEFLLRVSFHLSEVVCGTPNFIPAFLKASLNLFRAALIKKEISLEGIKAPEALKEHFRFKSEMKSQGKISPVGQGSEEGQDGDGSGVILEKFPEALKEHSRIKSEMKSQLGKDAMFEYEVAKAQGKVEYLQRKRKAVGEHLKNVDEEIKQLRKKKKKLQKESEEHDEEIRQAQNKANEWAQKRGENFRREGEISQELKEMEKKDLAVKIALLCPGKSEKDLEDMLKCVKCQSIPNHGENPIWCVASAIKSPAPIATRTVKSRVVPIAGSIGTKARQSLVGGWKCWPTYSMPSSM